MLRLSLVILPPSCHVGSILCHVEPQAKHLFYIQVEIFRLFQSLKMTKGLDVTLSLNMTRKGQYMPTRKRTAYAETNPAF